MSSVTVVFAGWRYLCINPSRDWPREGRFLFLRDPHMSGVEEDFEYFRARALQIPETEWFVGNYQKGLPEGADPRCAKLSWQSFKGLWVPRPKSDDLKYIWPSHLRKRGVPISGAGTREEQLTRRGLL